MVDNAQQIYAGGYQRESNYYYTPVGIELVFGVWDFGKLTLVAEHDNFTGGLQISHLSDPNPGYNDTENVQDKGSGDRWSVEYRFKCNGLDLELTAFGRYWNIAESEPDELFLNGADQGAVVEPNNVTNESGISFGMNF